MFWEDQQIQAAHTYTLLLGDLIGAQPQLYSNFVSAYQSAGLFSPVVNLNDIISFKKDVLLNGLPSNIQAVLAELGADSKAINQIRYNILDADPNEILALGRGRFTGALVDPTFTASLVTTSNALKQGVIGGRNPENPQAVPTPALLPGLVMLFMKMKFRKKRGSCKQTFTT